MQASFDKAHPPRHQLASDQLEAPSWIDDKHRHVTVTRIRNHPGGVVAKDTVN
jgi:hypothetical protein